MKKTLILALALTMVASLSFAANARFVQPNATFTAGSPATTNNDDSCDIAVAPAATLLLPHFEVDYTNGPGGGPNTNFSITNTSRIPQIAHVTIWTDWSFPVLDFNIFLTGYDVAPVSLYDIIGRGQLPATTATVKPGALSAANPNPNWAAGAVAACTSLPANLPAAFVAEIQAALTTGDYFTCDGQVGSDDHGPNAVGYVTVDVANTCSQTLPTSAAYYTGEILYDNTLIGEYYRIDPRADTGNYAGGNPMVHIRAIPEGGPAGIGTGATNLPFTFYDRYTVAANDGVDRRQPLPGSFAARFIYTDTDFQTNYAIWREGMLTGAVTEDCGTALTGNAAIPYTDIVRFDEQENPTFITIRPDCGYSPCPTPETVVLPETSSTPVSDSTVFPPDYANTADAGGWMYLNLNHGEGDPTVVTTYAPVRQDGGALAGRSQNWVIVQMTAFGRYGVDFDAAYIENGCSVRRPVIMPGVVQDINYGNTANVTP